MLAKEVGLVSSPVRKLEFVLVLAKEVGLLLNAVRKLEFEMELAIDDDVDRA